MPTEPFKQPIEIAQGEDKVFDFELQDSSGGALDLTGRTLEFAVRKQASHVDPNVLISKSSTVAGEIDFVPPLSNGEATVTFAPADTLALTPGDYLYDMVLIEAGGEQDQIIPPSRFTVTNAIYRA